MDCHSDDGSLDLDAKKMETDQTTNNLPEREHISQEIYCASEAFEQSGSLSSRPTAFVSSNELAATHGENPQRATLENDSNDNGSQLLKQRDEIIVNPSNNKHGEGEDHEALNKMDSKSRCSYLENRNNKSISNEANDLMKGNFISQDDKEKREVESNFNSCANQNEVNLSTCNHNFNPEYKRENEENILSTAEGSKNDEILKPSTASLSILEEKSYQQCINYDDHDNKSSLETSPILQDADIETRSHYDDTIHSNCDKFVHISTAIPCSCPNNIGKSAKVEHAYCESKPLFSSSKNLTNDKAHSQNGNNMKLHLQYNEVDYKERINHIKQSAVAVQKLKVELYLEAVRVHQGDDTERKFADYWNSFGQYVSTPDPLSTKQHHRSNCDINMAGVEAVLNQFLITKSLRRKHNNMVKAMMKQCIENQLLESRVLNHVPNQWNKKIHKVNRLNIDKDDARGIKAMQERLNVNYLLQFNKEDTSFSDQGDKNVESIPQKVISSSDSNKMVHMMEDCKLKSNETVETVSEVVAIGKVDQSNNQGCCRLPGMIEIDYASRAALKGTGYSLSQKALWLVTASVRDYIMSLLQHAIRAATNRENECEGESIKKLSRKRSRITPFDVVSALDSQYSTKFSTRIVWERCISEIDQNQSFNEDLKSNAAIEEITNMIVMTPSKKLKIDVSPIRANGKGKNLSAMVMRYQLDAMSKKGSTTSDTANLNQDSSLVTSRMNRNKSRPPSTITLQDSSRPPSSCDLSINPNMPPSSNSKTANIGSISPLVFSSNCSVTGSHNTKDAASACVVTRNDDSIDVTTSSKPQSDAV